MVNPVCLVSSSYDCLEILEAHIVALHDDLPRRITPNRCSWRDLLSKCYTVSPVDLLIAMISGHACLQVIEHYVRIIHYFEATVNGRLEGLQKC